MASAGSVVQDCFHSYPAGLCHQLSQQGTSWADLLSENSFGILHLTTDCQMQSDNPNLVFKQKKKKIWQRWGHREIVPKKHSESIAHLCHLEETTFSWRAKLLGVDVQYWKWLNKVNDSLPSVLSLCDCQDSDSAISPCFVKYPDDLVRLGH